MVPKVAGSGVAVMVVAPEVVAAAEAARAAAAMAVAMAEAGECSVEVGDTAARRREQRAGFSAVAGWVGVVVVAASVVLMAAAAWEECSVVQIER